MMNKKEEKIKCKICGQLFDPAILNQVLYHEQPVHKPMTAIKGLSPGVKVREVDIVGDKIIKIACEVCGYLMESKCTPCPNCGYHPCAEG